MSHHPRTPPSPSQHANPDLIPKSRASPASNVLLTPAHSVNDSMATGLATDVPISREAAAQKRKRSIDDQGDGGLSKKVHVEDSRLDIDDLHFDVGKKYLLCRTPHPHMNPDLTRDLFADYGLHEIAASVARETPNGQKQAIRKTYKGQMKTLGIAGRFDADRKELGDPDTLYAMISKPQDFWDMEMSSAADLELGFSQDVLDGLAKATTMQRGTVKQSVWSAEVLGEVGKIAPSPAVSTPKTGMPAAKTAPLNPVVARAVKPDAMRAKRNIRKRSYADSSFEGYTETFAEDFLEDSEFSTGEGEGLRKKSKKTSISMPPQRQYSYGPGMVGA